MELSPTFYEKVEGLRQRKQNSVAERDQREIKQVSSTVHQMYLARGWTPIALSSLGYTSSDSAIWAITQNQKLAVADFVDGAAEIKTSAFQALLDDRGDDLECITIVCKSGITANIKNIEKNTKGKVELFRADDLKSNITEHELQPMFQKMDKQEATVFKRKYGSGLSTLLKQDPIARFLRFQTGDVIKVSPKTEADVIGEIIYKIVK